MTLFTNWYFIVIQNYNNNGKERNHGGKEEKQRKNRREKEEKEKPKNPPQHLDRIRLIDLGSSQNGQTHLNHRWLGMEEPDPRVSKHKGFRLEFENN